jgi:YVTN family beta-propeller protein
LAISPDGSTLYVANSGTGSISVIDLASGSVSPTPITLGVGTQPQGLALTPDGNTLYAADSGTGDISVIDLAANPPTVSTVSTGAGSDPVAIAVTPDQAPVASVQVSPGAAGALTTLDASPSTVAFGTIATYAWNFGDGTSTITSTPTTTHTYATAGTYAASVTETSSGGTSSTTVYDGQQMLRNGGPSSSASFAVTVPPAPPPPPTSPIFSLPPPSARPPTPTPTPTPTPSPAPAPAPTPIHPLTLPQNLAAPIPTPTPSPDKSDTLHAVPPSGTPGLAVSLGDRHLTSTCKPDHTIYVFFDDQLVTQAQATGDTFEDTDVIVPGDAATGRHQFELSCTDVDPWLASVRFEVTQAVDHPMGWITSLPHPGNLIVGPSTWAKAAGISAGLLALILVYLLGFPAEWFNDTYNANEARMMAAARRRFPKLLAVRTADAQRAPRLRRAAKGLALFVVFVAIGALIQSFLDPRFGINRSSLWLFLGWCGGVAVVTLGFQMPALVLGVRTSHRLGLRVLIGSIVVAALCVVVSRLLHLEPGYCYGLIAVFAFRPVLPEKLSGPLGAVSALFVLVVSLAAWIAWIPVQNTVSHATHPTPAWLILEATLGVVFLLGIESVTFGMLPLPFLPGRDVAKWNRWVWAAVFLLGLVAFVWTLLQPGSGYAEEVQHIDLLPVVITCAAFAGGTVAFMAYFRFRHDKTRTKGGPPAEVGLAG